MPDLQRIVVVSTGAGEAETTRLRKRLRGRTTVLTAPTPEARRVVELIGGDPVPEVALAPVRFPAVDRGHQLDALVRRHAVADRQRDVVVVADPATVTLLLRVLAPDQLPDHGPVTTVGLPRTRQPVALGRAAAGGLGLGLVAALLAPVLPLLALPGGVAVAGLVLLVLPGTGRAGRTLLVAAAVAALLVFLVVAGSSRFPGGA